MKKINLKGVTIEADVGVLILILALINAILQMYGKNVLPISNEEVSSIISTIFLIVTTLWNTWKNRNITVASQIAQNITDSIKNGELLADDIMFIVDKVKDNNNNEE